MAAYVLALDRVAHVGGSHPGDHRNTVLSQHLNWPERRRQAEDSVRTLVAARAAEARDGSRIHQRAPQLGVHEVFGQQQDAARRALDRPLFSLAEDGDVDSGLLLRGHGPRRRHTGRRCMRCARKAQRRRRQ
jgi:hypothetical protein